MLKKFLLGQYSLLISFWFVHFSPYIILSLINNFFFVGYLDIKFIFFLVLFFIIFSLIGVWNSSRVYIQQKKKNKQSTLFGYLSYAWVIFISTVWVIILIVRFGLFK